MTPSSSFSWENSRGWSDLVRTGQGTIIKTNVNIVFVLLFWVSSFKTFYALLYLWKENFIILHSGIITLIITYVLNKLLLSLVLELLRITQYEIKESTNKCVYKSI